MKHVKVPLAFNKLFTTNYKNYKNDFYTRK